MREEILEIGGIIVLALVLWFFVTLGLTWVIQWAVGAAFAYQAPFWPLFAILAVLGAISGGGSVRR